MDEERLSLLREGAAGGKNKDYLTMGMELLQAASQSNSLAARYLSVVQQLGGDDVDLRDFNPSLRSDVAEPDNPHGLSDFQNGMISLEIDPLDPLWDINLDFGNFDDWLSGAELWGNSSTSANTFMSW
jgi:hypothetical protein